MADSPMKVEDGADRKAGYKSWKKKYRKMRITFDQKMHDGEGLHKQEAKALSTVKRLAVENDRLLDLLLEINNSPQIPTEKRIDLSEPSSSESKNNSSFLDRHPDMKRLEQLRSEVPHLSHSAAKAKKARYVVDLSPVDNEAFPAAFLAADDVDNYIHTIDARVESDKHIPSLAPLAHPESHPPTNPHLKNPTSVTNWLRKYAPKIFLQDGEAHGATDAGGDDADHAGGSASGAKSKSRGGAKSDRKSTTAAPRSRKSTGGAASAKPDKGERSGNGGGGERDWDASMDDDADFGATPVPKGKRKRDDDTGYKPRGSSTRPSKKKRKSEGEGTPTVRKSKKEASASKED